tara:strand:+ start:4197 stop:4340 length:144 start_codon:yes stop_codon:yes gene_type:complete
MKAPEYLIYCGAVAVLFFVLDVALLYQIALVVILIPGVADILRGASN